MTLPIRAGAPGARLLSVGDHRPDIVVTNDDLAARVDTNDAWIRTRTGIASRRVAGADETVVSMGAAAAAKALAASGRDALDLDLVVLATCSITYPVPGGAARVAHQLGAARSGAVDVNAACAGFCYALSWAADAIRSGSARHILVVASERLSSIVDWDDRGTCILFGDGAGAAVVGPSDDAGIGPVIWGSDGSLTTSIEIPDGGTTIQMDGTAVYRWATTAMVDAARDACAAAGVAPADLAAFLPHQANLRIVDSLARSLGIADDRVVRDVVDTGNTSAASIPMALTRLVESGRCDSGAPVLLLAFGAGLTYAGQVVTLP